MPYDEKGGRYFRIIAVLLFLMIFTGLGFVSSTRSLFVIPVSEALGVDRSVYSLVDSIRFVSMAIFNLFFGVLVARFGARRLIGVGFASLTLAMLLSAVSHHIIFYYLSGIFLGLGFTFAATTMVGYVVSCWCPDNRGTVTGAVLAANGIGGALAIQIVSPLLEREEGFRSAYFVIAVVLLAVGTVTVILFRDRAPTPKPETAKTDPTADGTARAPRSFLLLAACVFLTGFVLQGITGVAAAHMRDIGISSSWVSTALSIHMVVLTCAKFLTGFLYDRFGLRVVVLVDMSGAILVSLLLAFMTGGALGVFFALSYGVLSALALPLETVMLPIYAREFYGDARFGQMLGVLVSVNTAGYALGSPCLNLVFDMTGSYFYAFLASATLMVLTMLALLIMIGKRKRGSF